MSTATLTQVGDASTSTVQVVQDLEQDLEPDLEPDIEPDRHSRTAATVVAAAAGDPAAWNGLVADYSDMIRAHARRFRLDEADVADVVQTTWLRLAEHVGGLREPSRVGGWLAMTAHRESLRLMRRREQPGGPCLGDTPDDASGPEDLVIDGLERDLVVRAMGCLSERDRRLLSTLMESARPDYRQVATRLGMPVGSIGPTRGRALAKLREEYLHLVDAA